MKYHNKTITAERDKLLKVTENLPNCACKCGRGGLTPGVSARPRARVQPKSPRNPRASTTPVGGQPKSPRDLGAWTSSARGRPSISADLGAPTTSAGGQPKSPRDLGTRTASARGRLSTSVDLGAPMTSAGGQPKPPRDLGAWTSSARGRPSTSADLGAPTTSAGGQPKPPRDLGAWTSSARGRPSTSADLGAPTTSARGQPKSPRDLGTRTASARGRPSTSADLGAPTTSTGGQPKSPRDLGASTTSALGHPKPPRVLGESTTSARRPCDSGAQQEHVLVISDSVGRGLSSAVNAKSLNLQAYGSIHPSATIEHLTANLRFTCSSSNQPTHVVLVAGMNDVLNGSSPSSVAGRYYRLIEEAKRVFPRANILVSGIVYSVNGRFANTITEVNYLLKNAATFKGYIYMLQSAYAVNLKRDGIHPTPSGTRHFATLISRNIQRFCEGRTGSTSHQDVANISVRVTQRCVI